jgi:hypothetical protein
MLELQCNPLVTIQYQQAAVHWRMISRTRSSNCHRVREKVGCMDCWQYSAIQDDTVFCWVGWVHQHIPIMRAVPKPWQCLWTDQCDFTKTTLRGVEEEACRISAVEVLMFNRNMELQVICRYPVLCSLSDWTWCCTIDICMRFTSYRNPVNCIRDFPVHQMVMLNGIDQLYIWWYLSKVDVDCWFCDTCT